MRLGSPTRRVIGRAGTGLLFVVGVAAWWSGHGAWLTDWLPTVGYFAVMMTFARSLAPGAEPLIATFSRLHHGGRMPEELVAYTRRLTLLWAVVLGVMTLEVAALAAFRVVWLGPALWINAVIMVAVFAGEHGVRIIVFPHMKLPSPLRTGRIMLQAMRSRR